jgi:hypothetical protein
MMEAARTSETLVNFCQTTRRYNPEDSHLHIVSSFDVSQTEYVSEYVTHATYEHRDKTVSE